ncbi:MAG: pentapeptide repeat-containing protein, partial [Thaumarchaeota archaeon]|nr:pentapeptide repeat-containing protein [Nitrososphaerota archaeon]
TGTDPDPSGGSRSGGANLHIYDFTVGVSPSDQTVVRGRSAVYSLSLTLVPGSTSTGIPSVVLGVSGLPPDATSSFSAGSITPTFGGCTVCQTITVTTAGPPTGSLGDYTFHVTGTDPNPSGGSRSGSANLHIFDYTVSLSPPAATLSQGTSATMTVSVGLVPGSSMVGLPSVSLKLTGLPSGVTETGFPSSLSIGSSQAFTVQTSTVGSYVSCPQVSSKGGQNLKGADLQSCNLSGYNLSGDNLMNANLQGADLQNANLVGANLANANLASAYTSGTDFQGANMKGVDISASVPLGTFTLTATGTADGVLRSGTSMLTVYGDLLSGDNFQGTNLLGANLMGDLAVSTQFQGSNLMGDSLQGGDFMSSNFQGANMMSTNLSGGNFSYVVFQGANLMDSNMSSSNFNYANFAGSNTQGTNITGATFVGATNPP